MTLLFFFSMHFRPFYRDNDEVFLLPMDLLQLKVLKILAAEVSFMTVVVVVVLLTAHTHERRSLIVGIFCIIFGTCMYASPLSVMVRRP